MEDADTEEMTEENNLEAGNFYGTVSAYDDSVNVSETDASPIGLKVSASQEENAWKLCLQVHNNSDKSIQLMEETYVLEVWQDNQWYVMSSKEGADSCEILSGSSYDIDIWLEEELSKQDTYRLLCMFDDEVKGYVFNVE